MDQAKRTFKKIIMQLIVMLIPRMLLNIIKRAREAHPLLGTSIGEERRLLPVANVR